MLIYPQTRNENNKVIIFPHYFTCKYIYIFFIIMYQFRFYSGRKNVYILFNSNGKVKTSLWNKSAFKWALSSPDIVLKPLNLIEMVHSSSYNIVNLGVFSLATPLQESQFLYFLLSKIISMVNFLEKLWNKSDNLTSISGKWHKLLCTL